MSKKKLIATVEAEIATLDKRRVALEARDVSAAADLANMIGARRALLTDVDDPTPEALSIADRKCREVEDAKMAVADALAEINIRIADARDRLARLKDEAERERRAVAIEASATAADVAIERIRRAAGELDSARRDLAVALLPEAVSAYAPPGNAVEWGPQYLTTAQSYDFRGEVLYDTLDVGQVATRIVGHLVSGSLPGLGIARLEDVTKMHAGGGSTHVLAPVDGETVRSLLTDHMRSTAARVREGLAEPLPPGTKPLRRQADGWTTDREGRSFDKAGVPVTPGGFYLDEVAA